MDTPGEHAPPWYREMWPWLLMAGPAAVVVAGFATLWIAVASNDGLVVDNYYRQGLAVNQDIQRDRLAAQRGYRATATISGEERHITVQLAAAANAPLPDTLQLRIVHPTRAGRDGLVLLRQRQPGRYDGVAPALADGKRVLILEDTNFRWRLTGTAVLPARAPVDLRPAIPVAAGNV